MALIRAIPVALAGAALGTALLLPRGTMPPRRHATPVAVALRPAAPPAPPVFGQVTIAAAAGPVLAGIVGRLPDDAVALVRTDDGTGVRPIAIGQRVDGWTLAALDADAALFTRGGERLRVAVPDQ